MFDYEFSAAHEMTAMWAMRILPKEELIKLNNDELFSRLWPTVQRYSLNDPFRLQSLLSYLRDAAHLPGDILECGVARGGSSLMMGLALKEWGVDKKIHMCDTFQGLPPPGKKDRIFARGQFAVGGAGVVQDMVQEYGLQDICEFHVGLVDDTLPSVVADRTFALIHADLDLCDPTRTVMKEAYPQLIDGGTLVIDEYFHISPGVRSAINEIIEETEEIVDLGPLCQGAVIKGRKRTDASAELVSMSEAGQAWVSRERLKANGFFQGFLDRHVAYLRQRLAWFESYREQVR